MFYLVTYKYYYYYYSTDCQIYRNFNNHGVNKQKVMWDCNCIPYISLNFILSFQLAKDVL
jgi:hypothetical protein